MRPEHVDVREAPDGPADAGAWRVLRRRFTGTEILYEVIASDGERLWVEAGHAVRRLRLGDTVTLRLRDVETVMFPAGGPGVPGSPGVPPSLAERRPDLADPLDRLEVERGAEDEDDLADAVPTVAVDVGGDLRRCARHGESALAAVGADAALQAVARRDGGPGAVRLGRGVADDGMDRRPSARWPRRPADLGAAFARISLASAIRSGSPYPFHRSAYRAVVRSVLFGPDPPMRIGSRAWTGRGSQTASPIG